MLEVLLGATLAANFGLMFGLWNKLSELKKEIHSIAEEINLDNIEIELPDIEDIKNDLLETLTNMRTPSFIDHIGGAVGAIMQAKAMKTMQDANLLQHDEVYEPPSPT